MKFRPLFTIQGSTIYCAEDAPYEYLEKYLKMAVASLESNNKGAKEFKDLFGNINSKP